MIAMNAIRKRVMKRLVPTVLLYELTFFAVDWTFHHHAPHGVMAYLLAMIPALPMIGMIVIVGMYFAEEKDEFQRTLITQALIWGIGITLAFTTVWGFLELFMSAPHLNSYFYFPIFCVAAAMAKFAVCRSYR